MLTVSLTSVPCRFPGVGAVLESLLAQQGVSAVMLWIPRAYRRFPGWDGTPPPVPEGVSLMTGCLDAGPATKLLPALRQRVAGPILHCDDDAIYGPGWASGFLAARQAHPGAAIAASSFCVSPLGLTPRAAPGPRVAQGFAGVLVNADMFGPLPEAPCDACHSVDDIWLSAHLAAARVDIVEAPNLRALVDPFGADVAALQDAGVPGVSRKTANLDCAQKLRWQLGVWAPETGRA